MKKHKLAAVLSLVLLSFTVLYLALEAALVPLIEKSAESLSRSLATRLINEAVLEALESEEWELVRTVRDGEGAIVLLETDTSQVNRVKSLVSLTLERMIGEGRLESEIPLGSVSGLRLLSGRGPRVAVAAYPTRSVETQVISTLSESGINQTWHRVALVVQLDMSVMVLSRTLECQVSDSVVLADTVIVGKVPGAYTDINKIEDELLGDVVDFAATGG